MPGLKLAFNILSQAITNMAFVPSAKYPPLRPPGRWGVTGTRRIRIQSQCSRSISKLQGSTLQSECVQRHGTKCLQYDSLMSQMLVRARTTLGKKSQNRAFTQGLEMGRKKCPGYYPHALEVSAIKGRVRTFWNRAAHLQCPETYLLHREWGRSRHSTICPSTEYH